LFIIKSVEEYITTIFLPFSTNFDIALP